MKSKKVKRNTELKLLRVKHGLTQKQMAEKLGFSVTTYNLVETRKRKGSRDFWVELQKVFELEDGEVWKLQKTQI